MVERWSTRAEELYVEAVELSEEDRAAFLDEECGDDAELRAEVESLLTEHGSTPTMLDRPVAASVLASMKREVDAAWEGRTIGPYRLESLLGEGGMGRVFLAEQQRPIRRQVALKVMHVTAISEQMIRRFESERQALALMSHPAIARVYDAGAGERGELYVAMEHVAGEPLNRYCDSRQLSIRQRLELFIAVCEGVQHAHQKGVIHRDLKPSNVLVMDEEGDSSPKIIDFGIAKAVDEPLIEATLVTGERLVGTPAYMSPERFRGGGDVDTRADVYSLGVMLYEVLVGELPYRFVGEGIVEVASELETVEVLRPSARLTALEAARLAEVAEGRSTDTVTLNKRLAGDLDWITLKALEKNRERRYGSVAELAEEVRRHLRHEPVTAGPPSVGYRAGKFIRRHKVAVVATVLVAASMVVGTVVSMWQATVARSARTEAEHARDDAEKQKVVAEQVSGFLVELFKVSDPGEARGNTITAREILDRGADRISDELTEQPEVQAQLMNTIARVYQNLGLYDQALPLYRGLIEELRVRSGDELEVAKALNNMSTLRKDQGEFGESEELLRQALDTARRAHADPVDVATYMNNLATVLQEDGRYEESERLARESLAMLRGVVDSDDERVMVFVNNLAVLLSLQGKYLEAEPLRKEAIELARLNLGEDHPAVAAMLTNLTAQLDRQTRFQQAERYGREALALSRRVLGESHPNTARAVNALAGALHGMGRSDEAEALFRESLAQAHEAAGDDHPQAGLAMGNLAVVLSDLGRHDEAERLATDAADILRSAYGERHPSYGASLYRLASVVEQRGDPERAADLYRQVLEINRAVLPPQHPELARSLEGLGGVLNQLGDAAQAEPLLREAVAIHRNLGAGSEALLARAEAELGACLAGLGRYQEAEALLLQSRAVLAADPSHQKRADRTLRVLIALYDAWNRPDEAARHRAMQVEKAIDLD